MITLVLFDIDGTLVHTGGAGVRGMNAAFLRVHGHENALAGVPISGRTDRAILADACRGCGIEPTTEALDTLRQAYLEELRLELGRPPGGPMGVLPGVHTLIGRLAKRPEVRVGLLTGNFAGGAEIKLGHFDLWRLFGVSAFGDDHFDRRELVPVALAHAHRAGLSATPERVAIIGDTPLDVDCARANGAFAIGVATGEYSTAQLREAGADIVVETLEELPADDGWADALARAAR